MNNNLQTCFTEVKYVLKHLTNKIPFKLRRFITDNSDKNHVVDINNLSKRAYALLALIHRKYLAENEEKNQLQKEHQERLKKETMAKKMNIPRPSSNKSSTNKNS